jgi:Domain of unknown function (DUF4406)
MKIYLSGPITGRPKHAQEFATAAVWVHSLGHEPVDPHAIPPQAHDGDCPPGARNGDLDPHTWPCYLRTDLVAMLQCDALLMLQGHEYSQGASLERYVATKCGMKIYLQSNWEGLL